MTWLNAGGSLGSAADAVREGLKNGAILEGEWMVSKYSR